MTKKKRIVVEIPDDAELLENLLNEQADSGYYYEATIGKFILLALSPWDGLTERLEEARKKKGF